MPRYIARFLIPAFLATVTLIAEGLVASRPALAEPNQIDELADASESIEDFSDLAAMINEVEDRRRRVVYTPYPSHAIHGVQHGFVHVSDGSVAFSKTDMVVNAAMPIVLRRAYNSHREAISDFGSGGWKLTIDERIVPGNGGEPPQYYYGNHLGVALGKSGEILSPIIASTSDVAKIKIKEGISAEVRMRTGMTKSFELMGEELLLRSVTDAFGNSQFFEYQDGRISRISTSDGVSVELKRDSAGRLMSAQDTTGRVVEYQYNSDGQLSGVVDLRSEVWTYAYDDGLRVSAADSPMGFPDLEFEYDTQGRAVQSFANGFKNNFAYHGQETVVTNEYGGESTFIPAQSGVTSEIRNAVGTVTTLEFDDAGRPVSLVRNGRPISTVEYKANNQETFPVRQTFGSSRRDPNLLTAKFDKYGRVLDLTKLDGSRVFSVSEYKSGLIPNNVTYFDGSKSSVAIGRDGRLFRYLGRDGRKYQITSEDQKATVRSGGQVAELEYDTNGMLTAAHMASGLTAEFEYDPGGLRTHTSASDGAEIEYSYDSSGSLFYSETGFGDSPKYSFVFEIDELQQLRSIGGTGINGHHRFRYNLFGRLSQIDSSVTNNMSFFYDELGRLEGVIATGYAPLVYEYDEGESDLVSQLDSRTSVVFDQHFEQPDFGSRFLVQYSRVTASALGLFDYNSRIGELTTAIDATRWGPHDAQEIVVNNLKLPSLLDSAVEGIQSFSMPSSRFFIPPEYWSVNCCFCCTGDYACEIP